MAGLGTRSIIERVGIGNSQPKAARASALPDRPLDSGAVSPCEGIIDDMSWDRHSDSAWRMGSPPPMIADFLPQNNWFFPCLLHRCRGISRDEIRSFISSRAAA